MHQTRRRMVPGAKGAVLFIHGIVGTPRFWDDYAEALSPDWSVVNLLLPGHGGTVLDFGRVRKGEWLAAVETELDALLNLDKHESDTIGEEGEDREEDSPERSNDEYER